MSLGLEKTEIYLFLVKYVVCEAHNLASRISRFYPPL